MTQLGLIRIVTPEALSFAREKLRASLVVAGLRHVRAGQITAAVSQALRDRLPAELTVLLEEGGRHIALRPIEVAGRYQRIQLPQPPDAAGFVGLGAILMVVPGV
jgi:hypothetical protein